MSRRIYSLHWLLSFSLSWIGFGLQTAVAEDASGSAFFESKIRPLLLDRCMECHSTSKKIKGGLALDSRADLLKGGDNGPAIVPGNPEKSLLIEAVMYHNRDLQMPPKGALSPTEQEALKKWVTMGAPDPRAAAETNAPSMGMGLEAGQQFWSFRPLQAVALPQVRNSAWVKSPIDAFILAKLEAAELSPAPLADKRTLIRRATQDLTGLPPTPEEVNDFLQDEKPDAFSRVVERLLSSPAYGERWGRHWLDVARYADSNGMDENVTYGHAWRYRDYVIRAFNEDKPFDEFLMEQIAGDLLPAQERRQRLDALTATGFLSLGGKVLAEPDVQKFELDIIDEQLDTLGKAFLGMTFGCARCHDHKFDPITQADYYALAAIFRSTQSVAEKKTGAIKYWYEHSLADETELAAQKAHEAKVAEQRKRVTTFTSQARADLKKELRAHAAAYLSTAALLPDDPDYPQVETLAQKASLRPRYLLTARQYLTRHPEHPFFAEWRQAHLNNDAGKVKAHYEPLLSKANELDAKDLLKAPLSVQEARAALDDIAGFLAIPDKDADAFDGATLAKVKSMMDALMQVEDGTPDPMALMGVADGQVCRSMPIHIRGNYLTLGKSVERGFPEVMKTTWVKPKFPSKQSGRLELARWLATSENPLTARVFVNRVWRWHFGQGLVKSTDNFGVLGDKPSHPELLDWLALAFIENGWTVKDLHRWLMNSSVYQMASIHPTMNAVSSAPDPMVLDPENRLLWRFSVQRLGAEQIRDALFFVSGSLEQKLGGKTIPLRNREFVFNHTSRDHTKYESPRRAVYLPIIRNHLYDMLEQFDYPDPTMCTGSRNSTVVAPQALLLMNSPVVMDAAALLARQLSGIEGTEKRAQRLYQLLYCREPLPREVERLRAFIEKAPSADQAWPVLCQSLMAANEFIYLR